MGVVVGGVGVGGGGGGVVGVGIGGGATVTSLLTENTSSLALLPLTARTV